MTMFWFGAISVHLLAAVVWIGGMVFLSSVLAPLVWSGNPTVEHVALFRRAARRFRILVWISIGAIFVTGPLLLHERQLLLTVPTGWPAVVQIKIGLVCLLLLLTAAHDLFFGPRGNRLRAISETRSTHGNDLLMKISHWVPRLALIVGIVVLLAAVVLARS